MDNFITDIKSFLRKHYREVLILIFMILFIEIAQNVLAEEIMKRDVTGYYLVSKYLIKDTITPIAKVITQFGGPIIIIILAISASIYFRDRKITLSIFLNLAIVLFINQSLKRIVQRPRPIEYRIIDEGGYSFPSGHSMGSMAFYGFLIYLIFKKVKNKKLKILEIVLLSILIVLIGLSRIYLGVHYISDVLAGYFLTLAYLAVYTGLIDDYIGTNSIVWPDFKRKAKEIKEEQK